MTNEEVEQICLDDILITQELSRRIPRTTNLKEENDALHTLIGQLVPQGGSQKSKVKSQNEYRVIVSLIWNGWFIYAVLY
ncbi:MAG: hypothetical protein RMZ43_034985 [Nostoc sp. CmiVER01]|uniref:hypothetical protein n=1 Tax=Nostoc sp. CmiVER01 TaxID=3075384 RepID=UPI002AD393DD|nr:hypothetical protein [Nostoc sp. CmiVER01]MDZ8126847.1 hypothetical protein [Nostoc sp. CmiVER01]